MTTPALSEHSPVPERCIEFAPGSADYIKANESGKLVLVRKGSKVLVAVGDSRMLAPAMVFEATRQAWNSNELVGYPEVGKTRPAEGVEVQGAHYSIRNGSVMFFGQSTMFGGLRDGIFKDSTADVLARLIMGARAS
jgi:hypothetical protein